MKKNIFCLAVLSGMTCGAKITSPELPGVNVSNDGKVISYLGVEQTSKAALLLLSQLCKVDISQEYPTNQTTLLRQSSGDNLAVVGGNVGLPGSGQPPVSRLPGQPPISPQNIITSECPSPRSNSVPTTDRPEESSSQDLLLAGPEDIESSVQALVLSPVSTGLQVVSLEKLQTHEAEARKLLLAEIELKLTNALEVLQRQAIIAAQSNELDTIYSEYALNKLHVTIIEEQRNRRQLLQISDLAYQCFAEQEERNAVEHDQIRAFNNLLVWHPLFVEHLKVLSSIEKKCLQAINRELDQCLALLERNVRLKLRDASRTISLPGSRKPTPVTSAETTPAKPDVNQDPSNRRGTPSNLKSRRLPINVVETSNSHHNRSHPKPKK